MQIILEKNDVSKLIKKYYKETYDVKSCSVNFETAKIKDRLKEIDLFHSDDCYYNILFKTNIKGKIKDKKGNISTYYETLNVESTKEIVTRELEKRYLVEGIQCRFNFYNNNFTGEIDPVFVHMIVNLNSKELIRRY